MLHFHTLGGLRIEHDGQLLHLPTHKVRDLLAYLITFRDRAHPRSVLVGILWPDLPEDQARRRLSDTLWRARSAVGSDVVLADELALQFKKVRGCWLDVEAFEWRVDRSLDLSPPLPGRHATRLSTLRQAIDLYGGPYLDGLYYDWLLPERERLKSRYVEALGYLLKWYEQAGDYAAALEMAQRLAATEPLREAAYREIMRLYHVLGRDVEAIAQYQRCREVLREELGVGPAAETEALYQILARRVSSIVDAPAVHLPAVTRRVGSDFDALPLVGRDAERVTLLRHLEVTASGEGSLVLIEGEAGIGKSRLAKELVVEALWRNISATSAWADAVGGSSYGLLLAALEPILSPLRLQQLTHLLEPVHLQAAALLVPAISRILPDLSPLPDLPPPQARNRLQQALVALVLGLGRIAPHLWVLEDVHEADVETLSLLPLLFPRLAESRILILLTGRSAELRARPACWDALQTLDQSGSFPRYTLTRLNEDAVACLVGDLLGEEDAAGSAEVAPVLTARLARESEGVPLYLVETLKAWRDEGYLLPTEIGTWHWKGEVPADSPPYLGEAVISYRLSHLSRAAEEVLAAAAVIGSEVDFDLLARVCALPSPVPDVADFDLYLMATNDLLCLEFLVETDTGYRFSHEQVRRAVYQRLSLVQRRRLHQKVAQALETLFPEQLGRLGYQFAAAGVREAAVHYCTRAAERACEVFAHQSALDQYDRLLDLLTQPGDCAARFDVLAGRVEALEWLGDRQGQGHALEEMFGLARVLSDDTRLARALQLRSEWHRMQGRYEPAEQDALVALEIYRRQGNDRGRADLLGQLGRLLVYPGDLVRASGYFQEALRICLALDDLEGQMKCVAGLAAISSADNDCFAALVYSRRYLALAEASGAPHRICRALQNLALYLHSLGDHDAAEAHLRRALELQETQHGQAITHFFLGAMAVDRGDYGAGRVHLNTAREMLGEVQDRAWEADVLAALGRLAFYEGDLEAARQHLLTAYQRRREVGEHPYAVIDLSFLGWAELALGDEETAWKHCQEAVAELEAGLSGIVHPQQVYYHYFCVAEATRHWGAARVALEKAGQLMDEQAARIGDPVLREKFLTVDRVNRAISEARAGQPPPGCLRVRLARADAPGHHRPCPEETVVVAWTVDAGPSDAALAKREGKIALRRHRIRRLLAEAEAAGGLPTVADLAGAVDVSPRTINGDLAALRRQGHHIRTRGYHA